MKFFNHRLNVFLFLICVVMIVSPFNGAISSETPNRMNRVEVNQRVTQTYTPHNPIEILSDSDLNSTVETEGWAGSGTKEDPYIIENLFISQVTGTLYGSIVLANIQQHVVVRNNLLASSTDKQYTGIIVQSTSNLTITENEIRNYNMAIRIESFTSNATIKDNLINDNYSGLFVYTADNILIEDNTLSNMGDFAFNIIESQSIAFRSNFVNNSNLVSGMNFNGISDTTNCIFRNNTLVNFYVVNFHWFDNSEIIGNYFSGDLGMLIFGWADANNITRNVFSSLSNTPNLDIGDSTNNIISLNNFYSSATSYNHISVNNAGNLFYNNMKGNYWSKYTGNDTNGDGIGEVPFTIDPSNSDDYPLVEPVDFTKPVVLDFPEQLNFTTTQNVSLNWTAYDENPKEYQLFQNNTFSLSGIFNNGSNTIPLGKLEQGTYIFSVVLLDKDDNIAMFTTMVYVTASDPAEELLDFLNDHLLQIAGVAILTGVTLFVFLKLIRRIRR